jgi:hypothetical protein
MRFASTTLHTRFATLGASAPTDVYMEGQDMKLLPKVMALTFVVALMSSLTAIAASGSTGVDANDAYPLLGRWLLDTSRLPMPPEQRPRNVTFTFADGGEGKLSVHVDIVYAAGQEVHSVSMAALDGTPTTIKDSPEADTGVFGQPAPNVLVMALQKEGILVSTRIYAVTPDGQHLVETAVYPGNNGPLVMKASYFTRIR